MIAPEHHEALIDKVCDAFDGVYEENGGSATHGELAEAAVATILRCATFYDLAAIARGILDEHYPAAIFVGASRDPGAEFVVELRKLTERIRAAPQPEEETMCGLCGRDWRYRHECNVQGDCVQAPAPGSGEKGRGNG